VTASGTKHCALDAAFVGLYPAGNFCLEEGRKATRLLASARWYFNDELIAVAREQLPRAGFALGVRAREDVACWARDGDASAPLAYPPLVWIGSPVLLRKARLVDESSRLAAYGETWVFAVAPRLDLNRSYFNAASARYFAGKLLTVRGRILDETCVARVIWPECFRLDATALPSEIDATPEALRHLVRKAPRGGAQSPFESMMLCQRMLASASRRGDRPVLALILNGAQGDDDESHGGHFALITGRVNDDGAMGDWLVNNFYTLDSLSEKGVIAAPVTLDAYLADLNSGQAWYRPSYLIVAVLSDDRVVRRIQGALGRVYNQLYRHQLVYDHATMNCAGISVDVLRALGWNVAARGPVSRLRAIMALPWIAIRRRSLKKAVQAGDYLSEDGTRLFPAAAFEEIGADLLRMALRAPVRPMSSVESMLAADTEALIFARIPQLPSSRAWGDFPVVNIAEFQARLPPDAVDAKVVLVPSRPFPATLRDRDLLRVKPGAGVWIAAAWALLMAAAILWLALRLAL
jgi:hypothetical protein